MLETKIPRGNGWDLPRRLSSLNVPSPASPTLLVVRRKMADRGEGGGWVRGLRMEFRGGTEGQQAAARGSHDGTKFSFFKFTRTGFLKLHHLLAWPCGR